MNRNKNLNFQVLFPHPSFTTLLVMSANASEVQMTNLRCCDLEAIDLAALHRVICLFSLFYFFV